MESERKHSKERDKKKEKRKEYSSSPSEDEGRREKRKSRKSHKHHSGKEKKTGDKHKEKRHKRDRNLNIEIQELSKDDYFAKNNEFSTWLKEGRKTFFSDLSSEAARELFTEFIKEWNNRKLESRYYEGISTAPRSSHNWKIK